jgi:hypothetical protein
MGFWLSSVTHLILVAQAALVPVAGTVRDADSGEPLASAVVKLTDLDLTTWTNEYGRYSFEVPPGTQHVTVTRFGYTARSFDALVPQNGTLGIDIALRREPILMPPIEVRGRVSIRGLEPRPFAPAFPDRSLSHAALYQHPLLSEPDALMALDGGEVSIAPESPSGIHVRGGASDQVSYLIDGIPVFSPYHSSGTFGAWNPDALASVDLIASMPVHAAPEVLSGVVSANTRVPTSRFETMGAVSATQARAMVDGPIGSTKAGYLLSVGSAFPGLVLHKSESSHVSGNNVDWLGKVESPLFGGRVRLLGYGSRNDIDAAAIAENDSLPVVPARNELEWDSRSVGIEVTRALGDHASLVLRSWSAMGDASAAWIGPDSLEHLSSTRRDDGAVAMVQFTALGGSTTTGARMQRMATTYRLQPTSPAGRSLEFNDRTPVTTLFVEHVRRLASTVEADVSLASAFAMGEVFASPNAQIRWQAARTLAFSASAGRRYQFVQSLRNAESIVSNIFPAELYVVAGESGIPAASSDVGIFGVELRPNAFLRLGAQAYVRDFASLALVAPRTADPYASNGFVVGSGRADGFSLEIGASREHYGLLANYGYQRVHLEYPSGVYVPNYGAVHTIEAGLLFSPFESYSFRVGFEGIMGRRTTATLGAYEWEACNLVDGGCEFAGSPSEWADRLSGTELPGYFRVDLGVRKQWQVSFAGREGNLAAFATATNLLSRGNVLTVSQDPSTGQRSVLDMRPLSPVVIGLDWRF